MSQLPALDLVGRTALVTGGATGIGRAIADGLASAGAEVMVADASAAALERISARLAVTTFACDLAEPEPAAGAAAAAREHFGRLDILVCAGSERGDDLEATFACVAEAGRGMVAAGAGGRIVLVAAPTAGVRGHPPVGGTPASVAAGSERLPALMRAAAIELAPERITVNAVLPGWVRTEASEADLDALEATALNPSGMVGEPEDVARAALWLVDPENSYVTGAAIAVDGGAAACASLSSRSGVGWPEKGLLGG